MSRAETALARSTPVRALALGATLGGFALGILLPPLADGLPLAGQRALLVTLAAIVLWTTEALEPGVTALLSVALLAVTGSGTFGNVCAATTAQQPITIANVGACNLNVTSVTVDNGVGGQCGDFTIRNNPFPNTLSHDSSLPVTEAFTPTSGGSKAGSLRLRGPGPSGSGLFRRRIFGGSLAHRCSRRSRAR